MASLCILGRQPAIGRAELESLYGAINLTLLGETTVMVEAEVNFGRLGSVVKMAELLDILDTTNPQKAFDYCRHSLPKYLTNLPDGKVKLGVSLYGLSMPLHKINANMLSLKKAIKTTGRSVRVIPNTESALSSAQTYHNSLASDLGFELVFIQHDAKTYLGRITHVQAIDSYTRRDRERPKRDAFNGMLPPKLAQTIINLATPAGQTITTILDPFCGTGVILQEAQLMGYAVYGTDISPKMVDFSRQNLDWLYSRYPQLSSSATISPADATSYQWTIPDTVTVACEGYLGQPIGGQNPTQEKLQDIIHDCNAVMRGFLRNIQPQLPTGTHLCIAAPAWQIGGQLHHLPVISELATLGFERISFQTTTTEDLLYRRENQQTARELLVLRTHDN